MAIKTVDLTKYEKCAENIYEATVVVSKRARQINDELRIEVAQKLEPILMKETEDESGTNPDKLDLSIEMEHRTKPSIQAISELMDDKLSFRYRDNK